MERIKSFIFSLFCDIAAYLVSDSYLLYVTFKNKEYTKWLLNFYTSKVLTKIENKVRA